MLDACRKHVKCAPDAGQVTVGISRVHF